MSHPTDQQVSANFAILVTSDSRNFSTDETGKLAQQLLKENGHSVSSYLIVRNNSEKIKEAIETLISDEATQVIITSGGTGVSPRDKTLDTVNRLSEKELPGFGEHFRRLSYQEIGTPGLFSRASAFVINDKIVFCLPGSKGATKTALNKIVIPSIGHLIWELNRK
jgi:molybdenum cofactor biosynthesis protein B